jgi:hypothetical protein
MKNDEVSQEIAKWRNESPAMFTHPELQKDEVYLGDQILDVVYYNVSAYQSNGMSSARWGDTKVSKTINSVVGLGKRARNKELELLALPVFMNMFELASYEIEHRKKKQEVG